MMRYGCRPMVARRWLAPWLLSVALSLPAAAQLPPPPPTPPPPAPAPAQPGLACTLVFGHGRNVSPESGAGAGETDDLWNALNQAFNEAAAAQWRVLGQPAISLVLPVRQRDLRANAEQLLALAQAEGCTAVLETTVFGDAETELLVARLRAHAITRPPGAPRLHSDLVIAPAAATVQRELPMVDRSLLRLQSGELVRQMVAELRAQLPVQWP